VNSFRAYGRPIRSLAVRLRVRIGGGLPFRHGPVRGLRTDTRQSGDWRSQGGGSSRAQCDFERQRRSENRMKNTTKLPESPGGAWNRVLHIAHPLFQERSKMRQSFPKLSRFTLKRSWMILKAGMETTNFGDSTDTRRCRPIGFSLATRNPRYPCNPWSNPLLSTANCGPELARRTLMAICIMCKTPVIGPESGGEALRFARRRLRPTLRVRLQICKTGLAKAQVCKNRQLALKNHAYPFHKLHKSAGASKRWERRPPRPARGGSGRAKKPHPFRRR
jgi:hypothetical protein